jgi:hypothetical protein
MDRRLKSRRGNFDVVNSDGNARDVICASVVSLCGADGSSFGVGCRHCGVLDRRPARVYHRSHDGGSYFLAPSRLKYAKDSDYQQKGKPNLHRLSYHRNLREGALGTPPHSGVNSNGFMLYSTSQFIVKKKVKWEPIFFPGTKIPTNSLGRPEFNRFKAKLDSMRNGRSASQTFKYWKGLQGPLASGFNEGRLIQIT